MIIDGCNILTSKLWAELFQVYIFLYYDNMYRNILSERLCIIKTNGFEWGEF